MITNWDGMVSRPRCPESPACGMTGSSARRNRKPPHHVRTRSRASLPPRHMFYDYNEHFTLPGCLLYTRYEAEAKAFAREWIAKVRRGGFSELPARRARSGSIPLVRAQAHPAVRGIASAQCGCGSRGRSARLFRHARGVAGVDSREERTPRAAWRAWYIQRHPPDEPEQPSLPWRIKGDLFSAGHRHRASAAAASTNDSRSALQHRLDGGLGERNAVRIGVAEREQFR